MSLIVRGSSKSPPSSFKIGQTSVIFLEHGKILVANKAFNIDVKIGSTAGRDSSSEFMRKANQKHMVSTR